MNRPVPTARRRRHAPRWTYALAIVALLQPWCAFAYTAPVRNYLTVQGRVVDHRGRPLPGTWIFATGSRRSGVFSDSTGAYALEIPGATLHELEVTPLRIRVQARLKGWRFAMQNGSPELGIEMKVSKLENGLARLRVRSNDGDAVQAVANSVVLEANPRALLERTFIGSQGAQYETPPVPLTAVDEITVAGDTQSIPELAGEPTGEPSSAPVSAKVNAPVATAKVSKPPLVSIAEPPSEKPSILLDRPASTPVIAPPTVAAKTSMPPAMTPTPPPSNAATTTTPPLATKEPAKSTVTSPAPPTSPPFASEHVRANTSTAAADRPLVMRVSSRSDTTPPPQTARDNKPGRPIVYRPGQGQKESKDDRRERERKPTIVRPSEPIATATPPAVSSGTATMVPPSGSASGSLVTVVPPPAPAARMTTPQPAPSEVMASPTPGPLADPGLKPVLIRNSSAAAVGQRAPLDPQPVSTAPGVPAPRDGSRGSSSPQAMCDCTIRGTVEVRADRPLTSRTEVVVSIEDTGVSTSVELFMGSPRAFEIHPAPCGVHRFVLHTRSKQRFVLVSAEPRVVCTEGGKQQVQLVLEPIARWGATR